MSKYLDLINNKSPAQYTADALRKGGGRIEKGGEGSKGGTVVGHTARGNPIYQSHQQNDIHGQKLAHAEKHGNFDRHYAGYKPGDHADAQHHHLDQSRKHHDAAESLAKEGKHDEASEHTKAAGYHQAQIDAHSHAKLVKLNQSTPSSALHTVVDLKAAQHATKMDKKLPKGEAKFETRGMARKYIRNEGKHGTPEFERSMGDNRDLVKGGGWHSIPGGKHGGERRKHGAAWEYRYPDHKSRQASVSHHENKGYELRDKAQESRRSGDRAKAAQLEDQAGDHMHAADSAHANSTQNNEFSGGSVHIQGAVDKPSGSEGTHLDTAHGSGTKEQIRDRWMTMTPDQRGKQMSDHRAKAKGSKSDRRMQLTSLGKQDVADVRKIASEVGKKHGVRLSVRAGKGSVAGTISVSTHPDPESSAPRLELLERLQSATLSSGNKLEASHHLYDPSHTLQTEKDQTHVWDHSKIELSLRGIDETRSKKAANDKPDLVKGTEVATELKPQTEMGLIYSDDIMSAYFGGDNA